MPGRRCVNAEMRTLVSSTTLSLALAAVLMDETVYVLGLYAQFLGLPFAVPSQSLILPEHFRDTHRIRGLFGLCFGDQVFYPAPLIQFSLCSIALIDSHHVAK